MKGWGESPWRKPAGLGHTVPAVPSAPPLSAPLLGGKEAGSGARQGSQAKGQRSCVKTEVGIGKKKQRSRNKGQKLRQVRKQGQGGFPGGSVIKNPPANAGDTGSIPDPARSHMPRSN